MLSDQKTQSRVRYDELVLVVYSVLVGLSLDKGFDFFAFSSNKLSSSVLLVGIFVVVLENWVYLPQYFQVIDIDSTSEVTLYLLASITYSCIPALYFARSLQNILAAPSWILLNFSLICGVDAVTKFFTLNKLHRKYKDAVLDDKTKDLAGTR